LFWDPEPKNDDLSTDPIWCLGKEYSAQHKYAGDEQDILSKSLETTKSEDHDQDKGLVLISSIQAKESVTKSLESGSQVTLSPKAPSSEEDRGWPTDFLDDFESRLWFTYRSQFPPIKKSTEPAAASSLSLAVRLRSQLVDQTGFTSDTGWGCMIRSGQCLIANALALLRFGRDWRKGSRQTEERALLSLFADDPLAPFSLHKFVEHGASACGKHPGEWFGPSATARCIQALSESYRSSGLKVYVTGDGADVYQDKLFRIAGGAGQEFQPVLILVGIRLGIDRVNPVYWEALKNTLQLPQSIGIAGGRPSASHYFVGVQGDNLFFLDPHQTRPRLPYHEMTEEEVNSCHTRRLRRLHLESMDPSMLIAFLIRNESDWHDWKKSIQNVTGKAVLHVADTEPALHGHGTERDSAVDEVETFDDEEDDAEEHDDGEIINLPS